MLKSITLVVILMLTFSSFAHGDDSHMTNYSSEAKAMIEAGEKYHKDVSLVRKMHPVFMDHKRDATLREGVRSENASLKGCVNCHGDSSKEKRIDDKGQFCSDCHEKVGTTIDCFSCHRAIPK